MKKKITLPCTDIAAAQIIGNHGYEGYGTYVKLLQIMQKLPDCCLEKNNLTHVIQSNGMEPFLAEQLLNNPALFVQDETRYMALDAKTAVREKKEKVEIPAEHPLQKYIKYGGDGMTFPKLCSLPIQLSVKNCEDLLAAYPKDLIKRKLWDMEATKDLLKRYDNLYLTLNNWCRMALENGWVPTVTAPIRATGAPVRASV